VVPLPLAAYQISRENWLSCRKPSSLFEGDSDLAQLDRPAMALGRKLVNW